VSSILRDAAGWLTAIGAPMWRAEELRPDDIARGVHDGLFHLAECGGEPAGNVRFQLTDPDFWPDVPEFESAFIHRLAVRRRFAGGAVSSALLSWAVERTASLGRPFCGWTARRRAGSCGPSTNDSDSSTTAIGRSGHTSSRGISVPLGIV
jgi:hypothetical protein